MSETSKYMRPSIMEVYNRISEDEARARAKEETERDACAERWLSGQRSIVASRSKSMQDSNTNGIRKSNQQWHGDSLQNSGMDPLSTLTDADNASFSNSPSYTPPKPQGSMTAYPMESSMYPVKHNVPRGSPVRTRPISSTWGPVLDVDPLTSNGLTIELKAQDETHEPEKLHEPTIEEGELWKMIHLLKEVLKEPSRESTKPDETFQQMLEAMDATHRPGEAGQSESATNALAMELRLEKISMDDAEYAQQLDKIRGRLGSLVTRLHESEAKPVDLDQNDMTSQACKVRSVFTKSRLATGMGVLFAFLLLLILVLQWLRFRASYLFEFTYHDPLYQDFYPLPSNVEAFLSPFVSYNVPFVVSNHGLAANMP